MTRTELEEITSRIDSLQLACELVTRQLANLMARDESVGAHDGATDQIPLPIEEGDAA